ncbi:thioredoxin-like protein [Umbelopsis sp. PMI_123]|nr:thioredoxin-like protein [Umbelopsis sp. PMI_123]
MTELANHQSLEDVEDEDALFKELEEEDDQETSQFRERRFQEIQAEVARRQNMIENDHGTYEEISKEKEVMKLTTSSKYVVVHFFHKDFRRCDIMDKHLQTLAQTHYQTKFCKVNVENAPFLVEKMHIQVLPCVMTFIDGIAQSKLVGFDELGGTDGFSTALLEFKLANAGVIKKKETGIQFASKSKSLYQNDDDSDDYDE